VKQFLEPWVWSLESLPSWLDFAPKGLNSLRIRSASRPGQGRGFVPDGSNLPWVVDDFQKREPARFQQWITHLRTALSNLETIRTVEREDDRTATSCSDMLEAWRFPRGWFQMAHYGCWR
jgi:hypothetical protein